MNTYCLKCKKQTEDLNSKGFVTKNKKYIVKDFMNIMQNLPHSFESIDWIL